METVLRYLVPTTIGPGVTARLPDALRRAGIARPLVCADPQVMALHGRHVKEILAAGGLLFDATPANPDAASVRAAAARCTTGGCDGVVGFGGGSPLDLAKGVAIMVGAGRDIAELEAGKGPRNPPALPWIAVPTSAGTGSELSATAVIRGDDGRKMVVASPRLLARAALCDPLLTITMPAWLTAATGMDAISHCVEAICAPGDDPAAEAVAAEGLRIAIGDGAVLRAVATPDDVGARQATMTASALGALAFIKGLGAVHAASHAVGALEEGRFHHGTLNAVFLAPALRHNHASIARHLPRLREAMGIGAGGDVAAHIDGLRAQLGLPGSLRELGLDAALIPALARAAAADICTLTNPQPMTAADYEDLLRAAWG